MRAEVAWAGAAAAPPMKPAVRQMTAKGRKQEENLRSETIRDVVRSPEKKIGGRLAHPKQVRFKLCGWETQPWV